MPPPRPATGGHGVDRDLLILATSMLLLVVLLGGTLVALAAGPARSVRT